MCRGMRGMGGLLLQIECLIIRMSLSVSRGLVRVIILRRVHIEARKHRSWVRTRMTMMMVAATWTIGVRSLGLEVKLDSHLLRLRLVTSMTVWLLLLSMSQSIFILSLGAKRPRLNGDHGGCVGVNETGEGVVG